MRKQKKHQQKELIVVKVTEHEKNLLAKMALDQDIRVEKFVHELIFSSGLINCPRFSS